MATPIGLKIGLAIFDILSDDSALLAITGMSAAKIQPAPLKDESKTDVAVVYEFNAINPVNTKRVYRIDTAPLHIVDFTCDCIAKDYSTSVSMAQSVTEALETAINNTYNGVKIRGNTLEGATELYNKQRRYYNKSVSFQARVLL